MCADMTVCTYKQVNTNKNSNNQFCSGVIKHALTIFILVFQLQHDAAVSMQFWDNPTVDGFHALLMTPKPMIRTSDHVFQYGPLHLMQQKEFHTVHLV